MSYDKDSSDAMFSRIMEKLEKLDQKTDRIEVQTNLTNGRVTGLERWKDVITAKAAVISAFVSFLMGGIAWAFNRFI
jgi:hypothetical protein